LKEQREEIDWKVLRNRLEVILEAADSSLLQNVCGLLASQVPHYDWVGFYLTVPGRRLLRLGPFVGAATEHTEIPFGRGICGQAAESGITFVVQDVAAQNNYLSCSLDVKSEIVVPILRDGTVLGEIDIDSHSKTPFTEEDRELLEWLSERIALFL
jgi:L-methionine (R)-S-oxide reductase